MNKKRSSIILATLFLVQVISLPQIARAEVSPLADAKLPDSCFRQIYNILYTAFSIYKLDAVSGYSKEEIAGRFGDGLLRQGVRFDLEHIDIGKKGWTRYYPFSVGKENFIVRVFLTEEISYQPKVPVLFEANIDSPAVTAQVLPGISEIIKDCRIRPYTFSPVSPVDRSS